MSSKETNQTLKEMFQEALMIDELYSKEAVKVVKEWIIHQRTCAMIFQEDGLSIHLISKKRLLEELK
jgi:hypothetical protein